MNIKRNLNLLILNVTILAFFISCSPEQTETKRTSTWTPKRINKCIELLEAGQPIYYAAGYGGYEEGKAMAQTWGEEGQKAFTAWQESAQKLMDAQTQWASKWTAEATKEK